MSLFVLWLGQAGLRLKHLESCPRRAGEALVAYIQGLHNQGSPLWVATHTVLALQTRFRHLRGQLRPAWDSFSSWKLQRCVHSRLPLPVKMLDAICAGAALHAYKLDKRRAGLWMAFIAVMKTAYWGLLRPGELIKLLSSDCRIPGRGAAALSACRHAALRIRAPKNRAFLGREQVSVVRNDSASAWLGWLTSDMHPDQPVWPSTRYTLIQMLRAVLSLLGVEDVGWTLGSLRAGAATHLFESGVPIGTLKYQGRWSSERSLASYIQEAESTMALVSRGRNTSIHIRSSRSLQPSGLSTWHQLVSLFAPCGQAPVMVASLNEVVGLLELANTTAIPNGTWVGQPLGSISLEDLAEYKAQGSRQSGTRVMKKALKLLEAAIELQSALDTHGWPETNDSWGGSHWQ